MDLYQELNPKEAELVLELVKALKRQAKSYENPESDICDARFSEDFVSRLKIYHALNDDVLKKKTFEYAFARSLGCSGKSAIVTESSVHPGEDVLVEGVKFSLKTEASKSINPNSITISKLMEARWIRECTNGESIAAAVKSNVVSHLKRYDRILVLRAFKEKYSYRYRLVEIPVGLLLLMDALRPDDFSPRTRNGSSRAVVYYQSAHAFSLSLDGSVEKITIHGLRESLCILHGEWIVPIASVLESFE
ncbi:TPA: hypothetical protein SL425_000382 [Pseudomonas aeruginosa]|nr:hypothetical protein [Pseudomonas aeruginosa]HEJ3838079.1 hypothetical protein [Pseudomonas aeruginosa]HEK1287240.1 hypothetical protein [Pseudomonas aeruginosa]